MVQFEVVEQVANEFVAVHAEGPDAVSTPPMSQHNVLTVKQTGVKRNGVFAITHVWREGRITSLDADVNWALQTACQVERDFDIVMLVERLDVNRLPVDDEQMAVCAKLPS